MISRNEKNKKNNDINDKEVAAEAVAEEEVAAEVADNGKEENEKRLIITQITCVFLIAFAIWKIISM
jgi:hypothetical protein